MPNDGVPKHANTAPSVPPGFPVGTSLNAQDRKSTRLNSSHPSISYAVFCLKKKKKLITHLTIKLKITPSIFHFFRPLLHSVMSLYHAYKRLAPFLHQHPLCLWRV